MARKPVNMGEDVVCTRCKASLSRSAFYRSSYKKNGLHSRCKVCMDAWRKTKLAEDAEYKRKQNQHSRNWASRNRDQMLDLYRCYNMRRKYGMSAEAVDAFHDAHGNRCGICGEQKPLSVDHDHLTGAIRGSLCADCNFGIGNFKDSPALLARAIVYLSVQPDLSEALKIDVRRDRKVACKG